MYKEIIKHFNMFVIKMNHFYAPEGKWFYGTKTARFTGTCKIKLNIDP